MERNRSTDKDSCPECGEPKYKTSTLCSGCRGMSAPMSHEQMAHLVDLISIGASARDVAEALGVPLSTARGAIYRVRKQGWATPIAVTDCAICHDPFVFPAYQRRITCGQSDCVRERWNQTSNRGRIARRKQCSRCQRALNERNSSGMCIHCAHTAIRYIHCSN
jgi:hypothetical protein